MPIAAAAARTLLAGYVELFFEGLERPLPVFPNTSCAWAAQDDTVTARRDALAVWQGQDYRGAPAGEREDEFVRLALHGNSTDPIGDADFQELARRIFTPALCNASQDV